MRGDTMAMRQMQSCLRCETGNMLLHEEIDGPELRCLQCGATVVVVDDAVKRMAAAS